MPNTVVVGTSGYYGAVGKASDDRVSLRMRSVDGAYNLKAKYSPLTVEHSELDREMFVVSRPLRLPVLLTGNARLRQMSFDLFLGHKDPYRTVEDDIQELRNLATHQSRIVVSYGGQEGGLFHISRMNWRSERRHPFESYVTRATVSLTLTASNFTNEALGPTSGGASTGGKPSSSKSKVRYHVVKKNDSLTSIALKYYGKARYYTKIMDANNIKNPKKLKVGRKLRIP